MSKGIITFEKSGYIPTSIENCQKCETVLHDYGIYLNYDSDIANEHEDIFRYLGEEDLKEIYEKQGKPNYAVLPKYPNAPFIVYKKQKKKELQIRL
tara:strand:+ start:54 stop:341 length:288 start_codon:yes stop_codon:yes gene_type:complete